MIKVSMLAQRLKGEVIGKDQVITGINACERALPGDMTFAFNEETIARAAKSEAVCVMAPVKIENYSKTVLFVPDMKEGLTVTYNVLSGRKDDLKGFKAPSAVIHESADIHENVVIGANVVIGEKVKIERNCSIEANCVISKNVVIEEGTHLYPNVTVREHTKIGKRNIIHSGAVIGADGFGFIQKENVSYKVPQIGSVIIGDDVEIGANTTIDRGAFEDTVIERGVKIDNLVQIAHNVKVGENTLIAGLTGISGSTKVGKNVMVGGMVGIADHSKIGDNVKVGGKTGVTGNVPENDVIFGYPHRKASEARKLYGLLGVLLKHSRKLRAFLRTLPD